jgi:hypothetical protein
MKTWGADDKSRPGFFGSKGKVPSRPRLMCFPRAANSIMKTSGPLREAQMAVATAAPTLRYSLAIEWSWSSASYLIKVSSLTTMPIPSGCCLWEV